MTVILLVLVIALSGFLIGLDRDRRFHFLKAFVLVLVETVIGSLMALVLIALMTAPPLRSFFLEGISSLFTMVLLAAVLNGILLYWVNRLIMSKWPLSPQVYTLCEYIIQWALIYITLYQVIFDGIVTSIKSNQSLGISLETLDLTNPSEVMVLVLPSLISVWIAIILHKVKENTL